MGVSTGLVVGQFIVGLADGSDTDDEPDLLGAHGSFEFTPSTNYVPVPSGSPNAFTLLKSSFTAVLDDSGYLCSPLPSDPTKPGKRGLKLFATDDPGSSVNGWTWRVTPKFTDASGRAISSPIPPFDIEVPANSVIDLAQHVKVPQSAGTTQLIYRDTGVRDVSALLLGSAGSAMLRRSSDSLVTLSVQGYSAVSSGLVLVVPSGFRPPHSIALTTLTRGGQTRTLEMSSNGELNMNSVGQEDTLGLDCYFVYGTMDGWPTVLP